jgi:hypothetical protein
MKGSRFLLAYDIDRFALYEGIQIAQDALNQSRHSVFVRPRDVGGNDQIRQVHLQKWMLGGWRLAREYI